MEVSKVCACPCLFVVDSAATSDRRPNWRVSQTRWWSSSSPTINTTICTSSAAFRPSSRQVRHTSAAAFHWNYFIRTFGYRGSFHEWATKWSYFANF